MTTRLCDAARAALLDGRRDEAHLAACARCAEFERSLGIVDGALAAAAQAAERATLPMDLRARILAARGAAAPAPRGRLVEFALHAAAVAAVLVAGWIAFPGTIEAAELAPPKFDFSGLPSLPSAGALPRLGSLADAPDIPEAVPWALVAGAALTLLGGGLVAARRRSR